MIGTRPKHAESQDLHSLCDSIWSAMPTWQRFIIAVDGRDDAGKSTTARFIAWQLGMSVIELDTMLDRSRAGYTIRKHDLRRLLESRLALGRPVIVEGVFVLKVLNDLSIEHNLLVLVEKQGNYGSLSLTNEFEEYEEEFHPSERCDIRYTWPSTPPQPE